jgi:hypothetical protein
MMKFYAHMEFMRTEPKEGYAAIVLYSEAQARIEALLGVYRLAMRLSLGWRNQSDWNALDVALYAALAAIGKED